MPTANKVSNTQENPTEYPTTLREKQPTLKVQKVYHLQIYTTRTGRVAKMPEKYMD